MEIKQSLIHHQKIKNNSKNKQTRKTIKQQKKGRSPHVPIRTKPRLP